MQGVNAVRKRGFALRHCVSGELRGLHPEDTSKILLLPQYHRDNGPKPGIKIPVVYIYNLDLDNILPKPPLRCKYQRRIEPPISNQCIRYFLNLKYALYCLYRSTTKDHTWHQA